MQVRRVHLPDNFHCAARSLFRNGAFRKESQIEQKIENNRRETKEIEICFQPDRVRRDFCFSFSSCYHILLFYDVNSESRGKSKG